LHAFWLFGKGFCHITGSAQRFSYSLRLEKCALVGCFSLALICKFVAARGIAIVVFARPEENEAHAVVIKLVGKFLVGDPKVFQIGEGSQKSFGE
jgi:hypothetical protein